MPGQKAPEEARREQILHSAYQIAVRQGIDGLTIRLVASNARLSSGLVLFHYKTKRRLLVALLDWLVAAMLIPPVSPPSIASPRSALEQFLGLLQAEMHRLAAEPERIRLLFEFWVRGTRDAEMGRRVRRALDLYREAFRDIGTAVLGAEPTRFERVTAEGLATLAVSFIKGCAVQAMIDPRGFDIAQYLLAAQSLIGPAGLPPRVSR
jgi:AcrR family transcriptional regulator